jgi:hypothetical protein
LSETCSDLSFASAKKSNQRKAAPMPRPFGVPNISKKCRATKTTRLAETAFISRRRYHANLKQFSWKPPTLFQNVGAATREFSSATGCVKRIHSKRLCVRKEKGYRAGVKAEIGTKKAKPKPKPKRPAPAHRMVSPSTGGSLIPSP